MPGFRKEILRDFKTGVTVVMDIYRNNQQDLGVRKAEFALRFRKWESGENPGRCHEHRTVTGELQRRLGSSWPVLHVTLTLPSPSL